MTAALHRSDKMAWPPLDHDVDVLGALRTGSAEAFANLVRRHQQSVRAYLAGYLRDRAVIDDLAQDTFLTAYQDLDTFKGSSTVLTWLLGIARHRALEHLRAQLRRDARLVSAWQLTRAQQLVGLLAAADPDFEARERELGVLNNCLDKLAPRGAALVTDHYFKARSLVDIARDSGRKESTVRVELLRIRLALRRCLETSLGKGSES